jgi:hypothetical protein
MEQFKACFLKDNFPKNDKYFYHEKIQENNKTKNKN